MRMISDFDYGMRFIDEQVYQCDSTNVAHRGDLYGEDVYGSSKKAVSSKSAKQGTSFAKAMTRRIRSFLLTL